MTSQRSLMNCLDSIVSKIQGGVVINFEKVGADPVPLSPSEESPISSSSSSENGSRSDKENNNGTLLQGALLSPTLHDSVMNGFSGTFTDITLTDCDKATWTSCRKLIYVQRSAQKGYSVGHWPIPESFWPDIAAPSLPARSAHPVIKFTCTDTVPMTIENLPFDKYELEPCALTKVILSRKSPLVAWPCYVSNSHKASDSLGFPFGYLKASSNMSCVNLFVLPYNYPALIPLLDDLMKNQIAHNMKPSREWKVAFDSYLNNLPAYYAAPLKRALQRMGAPASLIPESMETCLSYQVLAYLKRLKIQAKTEFDKTVSSVGLEKQAVVPESIRVTNPSKTRKIHELAAVSRVDHPRFEKMKPDINDFQGFVTRVKDKHSEVKSQSYRNPYDITRNELIDQIYRMRANFMLPPGQIKLQDEDQMHSLPVCQMGNYQEYLKRIPSPLRELESLPVRQHMFGNPFKIDKRGNQGVQVPMEDIDLVGSEGGGGSIPIRSPKRSYGSSDASNPNRNKRKPGPLPKDYTLRPTSPPTSLSPSPPPNCDSNSRLTPPPELMDTSDIRFQTIHQTETELIVDLADGDEGSSMDSFDSDEVQVITTNMISPDSGIDEQPEDNGRKTVINQQSAAAAEEDDVEEYSLVMRRDHKPVEFEPPLETPNGSKLKSNFDYAKVNGSASSRASPPITMNSFSYPVNGTNVRVALKPEELAIKKQLFKLAKTPGKNYQPLFDAINSISNTSFKDHIISEVKLEALRFKRKNLVAFLNQKFVNCPPSNLRSCINSHLSNHVSNHNNHNSIHTSETSVPSSKRNDVTGNRKKNPLLKSYVE